MTADDQPHGHWAHRLAERRRRHLRRPRIYRIAFVVAGAIVTLAGVAMLALPGPAFVVIPVGLTMLAMEFAWAERALTHALRHAERAQAQAKAATPAQKALTAAAVVLAIAAVVTAILLWDIPLLPDH
jgi:uncharacterized protein (TIGR02611 family)